jgi:MSHA biogenesis protein MshN
VAQAELERTMSLLNQVLRDLDQRQAPSAPTAVKVAALSRSVAPSVGQRAGRWGLGVAATLTAIVAGGWAQGSLRWPTKADATPVVAVASVAAVPAAPAAPVVVAPAPVVAAPMPVVAREPELVQVAIAAPAVRSQPAIATPKPVRGNTPQAAAPTAEPRIEVRTAARTSPERAEAHYQRGVTTHQAGQINDSAAAFTAALREDPRHVGARVALAGLLVGQARTDDAMVLLKEGIQLEPTQPQLALMLARLQAERQDWPTAADTLKAAGTHAGLSAADSAEFHGLHAAILQRAGRHVDAIEKYGQALRLAPGRGVWWMGLAISLEEVGEAETARAAFQRAKTIGLPEGAAAYVDARLKQIG